ncbi:phage tail sheath family protein [Actinomycetospora lutea]|uniref:phage tail sheath family protein n=1 Tax=Actinomycetospora lutea TaxID=663604 RepID=UPI0023664AF6|nr:phage tail sheath C-terminal domain-containing protein [Actinomycetospora lutea]
MPVALTAGTASADQMVRVTVTPRDPAGAVGTAVDLGDVTVVRAGSPTPASPLELVTRLVTAINTALRADPAKHATLGGVDVEGVTYSSNPLLLRLQIARPAGPVGTARVYDASVALAAPSGADSFLTAYGIDPSKAVVNPSRYQLGSAYASAAVVDQEAGNGGDAAGQPDTSDLKAAITALDDRDPFFNVLCLPDLVRPEATDPLTPHHDNPSGVYAEAARVCGNKFAFLVVDPPPDAVDVGTAEAWKNAIGFASTYAAAWFPNLRVDNPLAPGSILSHPPSGAIAGVIARTDARVGVWQAPAGTDATIVGVYGPTVELSDREQGVLNPIGLNAIRRFPIYQTVGFGSRTIDGADAVGSEWKYIPVRRTASYILRSLSEGLRWAVHKGNGPDLWTQLRVSCTAFMQGLYRQGAFKGTSPREAYFVACDASTTTQADIDLGVVNIVIGFSPLKPAEFVVITLRQIVQPAA